MRKASPKPAFMSGLRGPVGIGRRGNRGCRHFRAKEKASAKASPALVCFWKGSGPDAQQASQIPSDCHRADCTEVSYWTRLLFYRVGSRSPLATYVTLDSWSPCPYWLPILPEGKYTHGGLQGPIVTVWGSFPQELDHFQTSCLFI